MPSVQKLQSNKLMQDVHVVIRSDSWVTKIKREWVKQYSWPRSEGRPWKESPQGTFRLIFSLCTGVVASPIMFLLSCHWLITTKKRVETAYTPYACECNSETTISLKQACQNKTVIFWLP